MKRRLAYCMCIIILLLSGCNKYLKEANRNGVGELELSYSLRKIYYKTYTADGYRYSKLNLSNISDTICKRCFNHADIENIITQFKNRDDFRNLYFIIKPYSNNEIRFCSGLFLIITNDKIVYPIIKLDDNILVNLKLDDGTFETLEDVHFIKDQLMQLFDSNAAEERIIRFLRGGVVDYNISSYPLRQ
jgi:hypothetical protein